ncbi:MAG: hypothetical protein MK105_19085 [Crocinitomicaceae bacterium]|nr:hypothetical protein [Crocinitomicaceae bacterium]
MRKLSFIMVLALIQLGCMQEDSMNNVPPRTQQDSVLTVIVEPDPILSPHLRSIIKGVIDFDDSLAEANPVYSTQKSYLLDFYYDSLDQECKVYFIHHDYYYNSVSMDGYFLFNEKYISVFYSKSNCYENLINVTDLKTGKIDSLYDTSEGGYNSNYDPIGGEYRVVGNDSLEFIRVFQ